MSNRKFFYLQLCILPSESGVIQHDFHFGKSMCYVPPSHFGQGKIIYANHLPWYIAVIVVFSKSRDKWLKNKLISFCSDLSCRWNCLSCRIRFISCMLLFTYANNLACCIKLLPSCNALLSSFTVLHTGFGKSMCYVPPYHFGQGTVWHHICKSSPMIHCGNHSSRSHVTNGWKINWHGEMIGSMWKSPSDGFCSTCWSRGTSECSP
jgi:hypothetical protein